MKTDRKLAAYRIGEVLAMLPAVSRGFVFFSPETLVHGTMAPREPCLPPRAPDPTHGPGEVAVDDAQNSHSRRRTEQAAILHAVLAAEEGD
ncbi:MAG: hypothetical protein DMG89_11980 [Acidobacteria bacterium]|nr:MAG: hypothetical protein DMG89_11980 [Acidobacteriota bacterium]